MIWTMALLAAPLMLPMAAVAQQTEVQDSDAIEGFRLDQPAGPGNPVRPSPPAPKPAQQPAPTPTRPQTDAPAARPAQPAPRPAASRPATVEPRPAASSPAPEARSTVEREAVPAAASNSAPSLFDAEPTLPAVSETLPDDVAADEATPAEDPTNTTPADTKAAAPASRPLDGIITYWPYGLAGVFGLILAFWLIRRGRTARDTADADHAEYDAGEVPAAMPALDLTEPAPEPTPDEPKRAPSGTIGVPIAKLTQALAPNAPPAPEPARPSAAAQGFVTTRAPKAEPSRPAAPSGTIGIPASRLAPPEPPPPAIELVEGTRLAAQFAAPELIRDTDGLRLKFALGIGNIGTMAAKEVQLRTVLLTAAPDSDNAIAEWMRNPGGPAVATVPLIEGGTQSNITGEIQLTADQIRAMSMQGTAIFVPMFAISIDFVGAEGLDRFGEAFIIGLPPERAASNGAARVLPLPHEGKLPRRWTDLIHRRAGIGG